MRRCFIWNLPDRGIIVADAHTSDCRGNGISGNRTGLVERIRSAIVAGFGCSGKRIELAFREDAQAGDRVRQQAAYPDDHCFSGEPEFIRGIEQTAEFVRSGYERVIRWAIITGLLAFAALGYAAFCRGIEAVESSKAVVPMRAPEIGPLPALPPIETGGCWARIKTDYVGGW